MNRPKYKKLYLEEKAKVERWINSEDKTGMSCPVCIEQDIESELIFYRYGELVCSNEDCPFDKTMYDILEGYYFHKGIGSMSPK